MHELIGEKEQNKTKYHFVLICNRDKAISIQGKTGGWYLQIPLCAQDCLPSTFTYVVSLDLHNQLVRSILSALIYLASGAREGQRCWLLVGLWVWDCKETRLRAGGAQGTGKELARLWMTHEPSPVLGLTSNVPPIKADIKSQTYSLPVRPLPVAEKMFYIIERMN